MMKRCSLPMQGICILLILTLGMVVAGCAAKEHEIRLEASPVSGGSVSGEGLYADQARVEIEAVVAEDYVFLYWEEAGQVASEDPVYSFDAMGDRTLTAVFSRKEYRAPEAMQETLDVFWQGFINRDYYGLEEILQGEARQQLDEGHFTREVAGSGEYRQQVEASFAYYALMNELALVEMTIDHPVIDPAYEDEIMEETARRLTAAAAAGEELFFTNIYRDVIQEGYVIPQRSTLHLVLAPEGEGWMVTDVQDPRRLLASFGDLYQKSICDQITDAVMEMRQGLGVLTFTFQGQSLQSQREYGNPMSPCLAEKTTIITEEGLALEAKDILEALRRLPGTTIPFLDFAPEDFFHRTRFEYDRERGHVNLYLTRPYAVLTMDTAVGFIDLTEEEVYLFEVVMSAGENVSDLYWSPDGQHVAYHWISEGRGGKHLHMYSLGDGTVIKFDELEEAAEVEPENREFANLRWSDDSQTLYFDMEDSQEGTRDTYRIVVGR